MAAQKAREPRPTRQQVRERLVRAAAELLAEVGFEASVEDISERGGFSRGAFYSNYHRKEELFLEALQQRSEQRIRDLQAQLEGSRNIVELMGRLGAGRNRKGPLGEFTNYMQFYFHCLARPELRRHLASYEEQRQSQFADAIRRILPTAETDHQDVAQWARALSALDHGLAVQTYLTGQRQPLDPVKMFQSLAQAI